MLLTALGKVKNSNDVVPREQFKKPGDISEYFIWLDLEKHINALPDDLIRFGTDFETRNSIILNEDSVNKEALASDSSRQSRCPGEVQNKHMINRSPFRTGEECHQKIGSEFYALAYFPDSCRGEQLYAGRSLNHYGLGDEKYYLMILFRTEYYQQFMETLTNDETLKPGWIQYVLKQT